MPALNQTLFRGLKFLSLIGFIFSLAVFLSKDSAAQSVSINTDGSSADPSAMLEVKASDKGVLIPRLSLSDVTVASPVTAPATGLLVYNTNASVTGGSGTGFYYWDGSIWVKLDAGNSGDWHLTGNSGTSPTTNFLGTTDAQDVVIRTGNVERMRITSGGDVGIGLTSPSQRLTVNGNIGLQAGTPAFVGTLDNNRLELRVNNQTSFTLNPTGPSAPAWSIQRDLGGNTRGLYAVDLQASRSVATQVASGDYSTIGGGRNNTALIQYATVCGGRNNTAGGIDATVGGGFFNSAMGFRSTIGGGWSNNAADNYTTVGGGLQNTADSTAATVGGGYNNNAGGYIATIAGGYYNSAGGYIATVSGGYNNIAGDTASTVGGGYNNSAGGPNTTIGGGRNNNAGSSAATVGGGWSNNAAGLFSTVGGGYDNSASDTASTVGGGYKNTASGYYTTVSGGYNNVAILASTVSGGWSNTANSFYGTVGGGYKNIASGHYPTVGGGQENVANSYSTVAGGRNNIANAFYATVSGGWTNNVTGLFASVGGGLGNTASNDLATVGGGSGNSASGANTTVGGGTGNNASGNNSTIAGGYQNVASGSDVAVGGGSWNIVNSDFSAIPGGYNNIANGDFNLVYGQNVHPSVTETHRVYFFGNGSTSPSRPSGFLVINRLDGDHPIHVGTNTSNGNGAHLTTGGTWTNASTRDKKDRLLPLDAKDILAKIRHLPVEGWYYKGTEEYHIGPYAEDFYAAFGTGVHEIIETDSAGRLVRRPNPEVSHYLAASDVAGVALLGVKAVNEKTEALEIGQTTLENRQTAMENRQKNVEMLLEAILHEMEQLKAENLQLKTMLNQFQNAGASAEK